MKDTKKYGNRYKFSDEQVRESVKNSSCISDVLRSLGACTTSGASHRHIKKRRGRLGLTKSDFGKKMLRPWLQRTEAEIFRIRSNEQGRDPHLYDHMLKCGFSKKCAICGISDWLGKPLRVQIHHKNGNPLDNRKRNLDFLCPNCHSQTETYTNKARMAERIKAPDCKSGVLTDIIG